MMYAFTENFVLPAEPRRGRARQGLAARQDARRPVAAVRQPALAVRVDVGASRQAAGVHGRRARAGAEWSEQRSIDWHLLDDDLHRGVQTLLQRPQPRRGGRARAVGAPTSRPTASSGSTPTTPTRACTRSCASTRTAAAGPIACVANLTPVPRHGYRLGAPDRGPVDRAAQHRCRRVRRQRRRQRRRLWTDDVAWHGHRPVRRHDPPARSASSTWPPARRMLVRRGPYRGHGDPEFG